MKNILLIIGITILSLSLSGCILEPYKDKDQMVEYFNKNYDNFDDIQRYLSGSNFYFGCWDVCVQKDYNSWYINIGNSPNIKRIKFSSLSGNKKQYIKELSDLFTIETTQIYNETNHIYIGTDNSLFWIIYRKGLDIKNYYWYTWDNYYFGNLTGNWYYSFSAEYRN